MRAALIFPHQLFEEHPALTPVDIAVLVEDPLFFKQYRFHQQKLILQRASMQVYAQQLRQNGIESLYIEANELESTAQIAPILKLRGITSVQYVDPSDDWLSAALENSLARENIRFEVLEDPYFLTPMHVWKEYASRRKRWYFTEFYISQRKRLNVLVEGAHPTGGKWSFDTENRKRLPKDVLIPEIAWPGENPAVTEAMHYVAHNFPQAIGSGERFRYAVSTRDARTLLNDFVERRLSRFGDYEDAIARDETFLFHSVLTPYLNIGLISPGEVVSAALAYSDRVPFNALEGFIRQVIGWREYMRGVYLNLGRRQRSRNFWQHHHSMPSAFYDGSTGILPVDTVIHRVLDNAYCHHIERLMVLGNFMLLCEISPDAIYQWFMELFIDAFDWVMVPNVYGMSQYADGGLITTKPYISSSTYIRKMSDFKKGDWCEIWDALYWRFVWKHRDHLAQNPRTKLMIKQCERMGRKIEQHLSLSDQFLDALHHRGPGVDV
ncbi:MAG TPA: cryptochrome/photolyase family protein [Pirellulaceae bacterium]|nr:cryptochrome/photolyase family protein [Pirellulaceae bacterium]HMO91767.1 cryptochrome/photolyase family protein [Pirellulaceae bacterium]HMP69566.1 cryptochrome/photolyase family protein [Pirellulaceae bacterium]